MKSTRGNGNAGIEYANDDVLRAHTPVRSLTHCHSPIDIENSIFANRYTSGLASPASMTDHVKSMRIYIVLRIGRHNNDRVNLCVCEDYLHPRGSRWSSLEGICCFSLFLFSLDSIWCPLAISIRRKYWWKYLTRRCVQFRQFQLHWWCYRFSTAFISEIQTFILIPSLERIYCMARMPRRLRVAFSTIFFMAITLMDER